MGRLVEPRTENKIKMSWQSYVDDQLISTKVIKSAVITGHDGNIWASSAGFPVTAEELKSLLGKYASIDQMAMNGVTIGGVRYMFLSATDRVVRAKSPNTEIELAQKLALNLRVKSRPRIALYDLS